MVALPLSSRADDFDLLRAKWFNMLTFGTNATKSDTNYYAWISQVESNAQSFSSSMATGPSRTFLWSKYSQLGSDSGDITGTYSRLRAMALGYAVQGSSNYTNVVLRSNILSGLDWMYTNYYNASVTNEYDNWFDWEIATPLYLNDTAILLYPNLSALQRSNYTNAIDYFVPDASQIQVHTTSGPSPATGANKVWKASVLAVRALIVTNSSKLLAATQALSGVFPYVTNGDGFYADGSFVFHSNAQGVGGFAYNGGYGAQLLATIGPLMQLLNNSPWQITDPARTNVFRWVYDSFEPFIYRGGLMEMVSGRYYTRDGDGHLDADEVLQGIISLAPVAPPADAAAYKSIMKYWIQSDTYRNFVQNQPPPFNVWALDVLNDPAVVPANELVRSFQFPRMDRALHLRPGWGFALSMSSNRRENYESIGAENLRGWYTGDGMTYLYNADLAQYADNYWSTVNPYRLPGTTVDTQFRADGSGDGYRSTNTWVGGASLQNLFGVSGMQFSATNTTLTATKSWFMFDDEVVCLGAGITSTDNRTIETIIENRRLAAYGDNPFTNNVISTPVGVGWSNALPGTVWAHLEGNVPGTGIGYFFPPPSPPPTVKMLREARAGSFSIINSNSGATNQNTRNYLTLWLDHGANPVNATYAYVLLPNQTPVQVASYAANPDIVVLTNTPSAQAVQEKTLGITAVNFWTSGSIAGITVDKKASVMVRIDGSFLDVAISDPTESNTGSIQLDLTNPAPASIVSSDPGVMVSNYPTVRLMVTLTNGTPGQTFHARFFGQSFSLSPVADAYVEKGTNANVNFGANAKLLVKTDNNTNFNREAYLRFALPPLNAPIFNATLQLVSVTTNALATNGLAFVPDNSWSEPGITWNNKPTSGTIFASWVVPTNNYKLVQADVTALAQQAAAGDGKLSMRVLAVGTSTALVSYGSKENTSTNWPQLILNLGQIAPSVVLNSPADGAALDAPASVTLAASAQEPGGGVASVDFYNGAVKVARVTTAPYNFNLSNLGVGRYIFTAVATDTNGIASASAPVTIDVYTPEPIGYGTGLWGEYYGNENLTSLKLTRADATINTNWGLGSSDPAILPDHFSVRWIGKLQARHAGVHTFDVIADDGARLWINGQLIIDNWITNNTSSEASCAISLLPGRYYELMMEYFEDTGTALAQLYWTQPGMPKEIIPQSQLYLADKGLRGTYFASTNLSGTKAFSRIDQTVNFAWGNTAYNSPDPTLLPAGYSVAWKGKVRANQSGIYTFYTFSSDGVMLTVNNQLLINNWTVHAAVTNSNTISLSQGSWYPIMLNYFHAVGPAAAVLMWAPPGQTQQLIPAINLSPNQDNNPPALDPIPNRAVVRSSNLTFTATATDSDPAQSLSFSLDPGAPAGVAINSLSGLFSWTPPPTQALGDYSVTVRVTDNGTPVMTDAQTVTITVTTNSTTAPVTLASAGGLWRYLDTGSDPGTAWRGNYFNDSSWSSGFAPLGYGSPNVSTTVSYGSDSNNKYPATYFRRAFYIPDASLVESLSARLLRDDGAVVYLNGTEIWRDNLPAGLITYGTLALAEIGAAPPFINQSLSPSSLITGTNIIAVEIHQAASNGPDILFDLELSGWAVVPSKAALSLAVSGPAPVLSWPVDASLFQLYTTTNLALPITWFPMTNVPLLTNNQWLLPLAPRTNLSQFYRLQTR